MPWVKNRAHVPFLTELIMALNFLDYILFVQNTIEKESKFRSGWSGVDPERKFEMDYKAVFGNQGQNQKFFRIVEKEKKLEVQVNFSFIVPNFQ